MTNVPTKRPPITTTASEPYMGSGIRGIMPTMVVNHAAKRGVDDGVEQMLALFGAQARDFVDEHDRVLHHHTYQPHESENGEECEGCVGQKQQRHDAAQHEREADEHDEEFFPVVEQAEQHGEHDQQDHGHESD